MVRVIIAQEEHSSITFEEVPEKKRWMEAMNEEMESDLYDLVYRVSKG